MYNPSINNSIVAGAASQAFRACSRLVERLGRSDAGNGAGPSTLHVPHALRQIFSCRLIVGWPQCRTPCIRTSAKRSDSVPTAMPISTRKVGTNSKAAFRGVPDRPFVMFAASCVRRETRSLARSKRAISKLPFLTRCSAPHKERSDDKFSRANRRPRHKEHVNS